MNPCARHNKMDCMETVCAMARANQALGITDDDIVTNPAAYGLTLKLPAQPVPAKAADVPVPAILTLKTRAAKSAPAVDATPVPAAVDTLSNQATASVGGCPGYAKPEPDLAEIKRAVSVLIAKGRVVELRAFDTATRTVSGYYNDAETLAQDTCELSSFEQTPNVYWTLQDIDPNLLARLENACKGWSKNATADNNVLRYLYLPFDFDPCRISGVSSSDAEKARALELATTFRVFLSERGIQTIFADSGNGYHLLARIDMLASQESTALVSAILAAAYVKYSTCKCDPKNPKNCGKVMIDKSLSNPSRILKAYGTVARKGSHTAERPWRLSRVIDAPKCEVVPEQSLRVLLKELGGEVSASGTVMPAADGAWEGMTPEQMETLLAEKGIERGNRIAYKNGFKWQLAECVFHAHHESPDSFIALERSGLRYFNCSHPTCEGHRGGKEGWAKFKEQVGGFDFTPKEQLSKTPAKPADAVGTKQDAKQDATVLTSFASITSKLQEWLWDKRVPIGALALWMGDPDVGKSLSVIDLTARVTRGLDFPGGAKNDFPPSDVILCEAEDSLEKTVKPRLAVAAEDVGADMSRVHDVRIKTKGDTNARLLQLDREIHRLEKQARELPDCRLIIISPISAYLGPKVKTIDDGAVRVILTKLLDMSERLNISVVASMHLNKSADYKAIYRASGAMGFMAVPRAVWLFAKDANDEQSENRFMMPIKGNLAKKQKGTLYQVVESTKPVLVLDERKGKTVESFHPRIQWGDATERVADEVMKERIGGRGVREDRTAEAVAVITNLFSDPETGDYRPTPVPNKKFRKATADFSDRTLDKAKAKLGVEYDRHLKGFVMDDPSVEATAKAKAAVVVARKERDTVARAIDRYKAATIVGHRSRGKRKPRRKAAGRAATILCRGKGSGKRKARKARKVLRATVLY